MTSRKTADIRLGTTIYSMTNEFHARKFGRDDLIREVARRNLGPGLEVVGFQSFRSFPDVSAAEVDQFHAIIAETGLVPTCLGINADRHIDRNKPMTDAEMGQYHARQLRSAAKLGFPLVRYQFAATPDVIADLVPLAEDLGVKLGLEVHAPHTVDHPEIIEYREMYERVNSDFLGFIPDFGATARAVPPGHLAAFREMGASESVIEKALEIWHADIEPFQKFGAFQQWCQANGVDEVLAVEMMIIYGIFNRGAVESWAEIMPRVFHIHGKFYDVDRATGEDAAIDYAANLKVFVEGGFQGYISSEWEGHMVSDADGFDHVERHHAMIRSILSALGA